MAQNEFQPEAQKVAFTHGNLMPTLKSLDGKAESESHCPAFRQLAKSRQNERGQGELNVGQGVGKYCSYDSLSDANDTW